MSCFSCYVLKLLLTSPGITLLQITFPSLSMFSPHLMHVYNAYLLPKVETCFAVSGPFVDFLHMNIPSPVQLICYLSLRMFPKCCLSICLRMLVHRWESIQGLDSGSKKPEKMPVSTENPQGPEAWLKRRSIGGRACTLNGGSNALFVTAFILDQLNHFSPRQPLKKSCSAVFPLAATFQHKTRLCGGWKRMDVISRHMTQIKTLKGLEKQVQMNTLNFRKQRWTDKSVIFCCLNKVGNITNIQHQSCKGHIKKKKGPNTLLQTWHEIKAHAPLFWVP